MVPEVIMRSDSEIERDVREELEWDPDLDAGDIAVSVKNGVVTLTGIRTSGTSTRKSARGPVAASAAAFDFARGTISTSRSNANTGEQKTSGELKRTKQAVRTGDATMSSHL